MHMNAFEYYSKKFKQCLEHLHLKNVLYQPGRLPVQKCQLVFILGIKPYSAYHKS